MKNELDDEIPEEIANKARALGCAGEVRYVYIDNEYDGGFPAASIGLTTARRFRSTNYEKHKQELSAVGGTQYVAFRSPSNTPRSPLEPILDHQIPPPPHARINEETNTYAIDDTPLDFIVEDGFVIQLPHNRIKAFCVQLLKVNDGDAYARYHFELRISYYMVAHKGKRRGTWQFGQFAPMMTLDEYRQIHQAIEGRGCPRCTGIGWCALCIRKSSKVRNAWREAQQRASEGPHGAKGRQRHSASAS